MEGEGGGLLRKRPAIYVLVLCKYYMSSTFTQLFGITSTGWVYYFRNHALFMERHDLLPDTPLFLPLPLSLSLAHSGIFSFSPSSLPPSLHPSPPLSLFPPFPPFSLPFLFLPLSLSVSLPLPVIHSQSAKSQLVVPAEQLQGRETQMEMFVENNMCIIKV